MKVLLEEEMRDCLHVEILIKLRLFITLDETDNVMKASWADMQWIVEKLMYIVCNT